MMRFDRFTERAQEAAQLAAQIIQRYGHNQIDTEHILLGLLEQPNGVIPQILEKIAVTPEAIIEPLDNTLRAIPSQPKTVEGAGQIFITPRVKRVIDLSYEEAKHLNDEYISTEHIFLSILTERNTPAARILEAKGLTRDRVYTVIQNLRGGRHISNPKAETFFRVLEKNSRNLTQLARERKLEPIFGRDTEILRLISILSQRTKNNPILIGDAGIGKSAIIEGLAQKIADGAVPEFLLDIKILSLDISAIMMDLRPSFVAEASLKDTIQGILPTKGEYITVIKDIHNYIGIESPQDIKAIRNAIKSALMGGELQIIGTTTLNDFYKIIGKDTSLERKFSPVNVQELTIEDTVNLLYGLRHKYEEHHNVHFSDEALTAAAILSDRYITDSRFPNKALDIIDEAASLVRLADYSYIPNERKSLNRILEQLQAEENQALANEDYEQAAQIKSKRIKLNDDFRLKTEEWKKSRKVEKTVDVTDIAEIIHQWTGIPVNQIMGEETQKTPQVVSPKVIDKRDTIDYLDFNLKISPHEKVGFYKVHVYQSPAGEANSEFTFPLSDVEIENLTLRLLKLRSATRRIDSPELGAARRLGTAMFQSVFQGQVRDVFRVSLQKARSQNNSGVRIKLRLQDAPELANLPWEFLFDSDMQSFLAQSIQTPIVRYMELAETALPLKITPPLQVLGVISSPTDYAALDVQKEKSSLQSALRYLIELNLVKVAWLENATLDSLRKTLSMKNYHVLHFIGHGGLDKRTEQGVLVLTDDQGKGVWIDAERLGVLLYDHPSLRLVILNACEGARNTVRDPFAGVATTLVRRGIPAVAAMQFEISDAAAITFAANFYASLAASFPVDAAIAEARKAVYFMPNDIEWGTPVLYLRASDGILFEFPN